MMVNMWMVRAVYLLPDQVSTHTDESDFAALFLYRKISKEPIEEHVLMAGPEVGATADEMKV